MVKLDMPDGSTFEFDENEIVEQVEYIMKSLFDLDSSRKAALVVLNVHANVLRLSFKNNKELMLLALQAHCEALSNTIKNMN